MAPCSPIRIISALLVAALLTGCGSTKTQQVTDQMLMSTAVDRTVGQIDFSVLAGKKVFLDTRHMKAVKGLGFVNADYIISSIRQQMFASHLRLTETPAEADYIVEARVGALGTDGHDVTYGVPASSTISTAVSLVPNAPNIPALPELSLARRQIQIGGAKIAFFAYDRESKRPIWQSGVATAMSDARNIWVLGAGPFQRGSIFDGTQFAGSRLELPLIPGDDGEGPDRVVTYDDEHVFAVPPGSRSAVQLSNYVKPVDESKPTPSDDEKETK